MQRGASRLTQALGRMHTIVAASDVQFAEVLRWLEREERESFEGFYCKRDDLAESQAKGEMFCACSGDYPVAFVTMAVKSVGYIELLEVHPSHRRKGFGRKLAAHAISQLFFLGAPSISVTCAPRSSESFWRALGFVTPQGSTQHHHESPRLTLVHAP